MMSCFVFLAFAFTENVGCIRGRVGPKVTEKVSRGSCYIVLFYVTSENTQTQACLTGEFDGSLQITAALFNT
jgi:hypothetical protein